MRWNSVYRKSLRFKRLNRHMANTVAGFVILISLFWVFSTYQASLSMTTHSQLLTDPFLQMPAENSVRVVWFTEFAGSRHTVIYGKDLNKEVIATTTQLSRTREDSRSQVKGQTKDNPIFTQPTRRNIWRHEAKIENLISGEKVPYSVASVRENGEKVESAVFTLAPAPSAKQPLKILLTSDHQLMPMTAANLEKVVETVGKVDAVFHAGDLINIPDRASEWFDDDRGGAFFPSMQGRANYELEKNDVKTVYKGGELIQNAPLFTTIGNHEVIGRFSMESSLNEQLYDAYPRAAAQQLSQNADEIWLKNNSFNTDTYEEIFSLPESNEGGEKYYAVTFGDVRLVVPFITNVWRVESLNADAKGRYREREQDFNNPADWGYGQHIFEPIVKGSVQYNWLEKELNSPEFKQAKYKVVMFHHPPHTLGGNIVPAYTDPVQMIERNSSGNIQAIGYEYPKDADYIIRDVVPLLEAAGVQLVFYGHSHLWNRFVDSQGIHFLETSNVGNSYGAAVAENPRNVPAGYQEEYAGTGNPNGLEPVMPTIAPILDENGKPVSYIASNDLTVFSILDTAAGTVSSYYFDTRLPQSNVVKFDEFTLGVPARNQK